MCACSADLVVMGTIRLFEDKCWAETAFCTSMMLIGDVVHVWAVFIISMWHRIKGYIADFQHECCQLPVSENISIAPQHSEPASIL